MSEEWEFNCFSPPESLSGRTIAKFSPVELELLPVDTNNKWSTCHTSGDCDWKSHCRLRHITLKCESALAVVIQMVWSKKSFSSQYAVSQIVRSVKNLAKQEKYEKCNFQSIFSACYFPRTQNKILFMLSSFAMHHPSDFYSNACPSVTVQHCNCGENLCRIYMAIIITNSALQSFYELPMNIWYEETLLYCNLQDC